MRAHTDDNDDKVDVHGQQIAKVVLMLMIKHGVTRDQLGAVLDVHQSGISRRLKRGKGWQVEDLFIMADLFHVEPGEFLGDPARWGEVRTGSSWSVIDGPAQPELPFQATRPVLTLV